MGSVTPVVMPKAQSMSSERLPAGLIPSRREVSLHSRGAVSTLAARTNSSHQYSPPDILASM